MGANARFGVAECVAEHRVAVLGSFRYRDWYVSGTDNFDDYHTKFTGHSQYIDISTISM